MDIQTQIELDRAMAYSEVVAQTTIMKLYKLLTGVLIYLYFAVDFTTSFWTLVGGGFITLIATYSVVILTLFGLLRIPVINFVTLLGLGILVTIISAPVKIILRIFKVDYTASQLISSAFIQFFLFAIIQIVVSYYVTKWWF